MGSILSERLVLSTELPAVFVFGIGMPESRCRVTRTRDRDLARSFLAKVERDAFAARPAGRPAPHRAATGHTVAHALDYILTSGLNHVSAATLDCYAKKAGHSLRLLGGLYVNRISMQDVQGYIDTRKVEGAHSNTIYKELVVLRLALQQAHDLKLMREDPRALFPKFSAGYVPRDRYLTREEAAALMRELGTPPPLGSRRHHHLRPALRGRAAALGASTSCASTSASAAPSSSPGPTSGATLPPRVAGPTSPG